MSAEGLLVSGMGGRFCPNGANVPTGGAKRARSCHNKIGASSNEEAPIFYSSFSLSANHFAVAHLHLKFVLDIRT